MGIGIRTYPRQETTWMCEYSHCLQRTGCHRASTMKSQIQLVCRLRSLGGNLKSAPPGGQGETQEGGRTLRAGGRPAHKQGNFISGWCWAGGFQPTRQHLGVHGEASAGSQCPMPLKAAAWKPAPTVRMAGRAPSQGREREGPPKAGASRGSARVMSSP